MEENKDAEMIPMLIDAVSDAKLALGEMTRNLQNTVSVTVEQARVGVDMAAKVLIKIQETLSDEEFLECRKELGDVVIRCNEIAIAKEVLKPVLLPLGDIIAMMMDLAEGDEDA